MYQTTIQSINGTTATDTQGKMLYIAGNSHVTAGQQVWTDGKIIYGNTYGGGSAFVPVPVINGIAWLVPYQEIQIIDKSLNKTKKLCETSASYIVYDNKNFNAFINGHWVGLPAIQGYTPLDACYNKDGDLLEIGYVGRPSYIKGYKGKTEAMHVYVGESEVQGGLGRYYQMKFDDNYKYQAYYDYEYQTDGNSDFIKMCKNGEVEKSLNIENVIKSLETDLNAHAVDNMGMRDIYRMTESVSLGKYQMTRNQDGGFTCLLSITCTYVAYCVKFREIKEYWGGIEDGGSSPKTDSHHFAKITAEWRVLVTDKGTEIINKNYSIKGVGVSRGYLWWTEPGDSADWPCYYTVQPKGYGGDIDTPPRYAIKGLEVWWTSTGWSFVEHISGFEGNVWIIDDDHARNSETSIKLEGSFSDPDFFNSQAKSENIGSYSWRLDNGIMEINEKDYTLSINGCSFDWWTNTIFSAYPYKEGYLFVVFYLRESKIKLIYWDGSEQREVASCPYVGDYCRAFRICEVKNTAKIKRLAGVTDDG